MGGVAPQRSRRVALLLFLLLWPTYAYFYQSGEHNEAARLDAARALVEDGVLWVDTYAYNSADLIQVERNGVRHFYSGKAPGSTLLVAPPIWIFSKLAGLLPFPDWERWHAVVYLTAVSTVSLLSAAAAVAMWGVAARVTGSAPLALAGVVAVWLGTIVFPFSTLLFGHAVAAAFLVLAFAILFRLRWEGPGAFRRPSLALGIAGLLAGASVVTEYPTAILVGWLGLYLLYTLARLEGGSRTRLTWLAAFAAGGLLAAGVLAAYNVAAFGKILYVPYEAYTEGAGARMFPAHQHGFLGVAWPGLGSFLDVLAEITVRPQRGVAYLGFDGWRIYALSPVLWLAIPGLALLLARRATRPEGCLVAAAAVSFLVFNACYGDSIVYWGGGASVGPRHLVPMLAFLALPLARAARPLALLFYPLLLISVFYALLATAVEPRVGYDYRNPARDLFHASYMEGRLAQNRGGLFDPQQRLLTEDSVAFNWGKLAGLPGAWQLAPLMIWWLAVGGALLGASGASRPKLGVIVLGTYVTLIAVSPWVLVRSAELVRALRAAPAAADGGSGGPGSPSESGDPTGARPWPARSS
jgi:hypothetical protein